MLSSRTPAHLPRTYVIVRQRTGDALVRAWDALNNTGRPVLVVVGPEDLLSPARLALGTVSAADPTACPYDAYWDPDGDEALWVLGGLDGASVGVAWPPDAAEDEFLALASRHAQALKTLHAKGYVGLRPGPEEVFWNPKQRLAVLLGWEWVTRRADGPPGDQWAAEDLKAAASLWVLLLTGTPAPRFPPLTPTTDWFAWQQLRLDLRRLLADLLSSQANGWQAAKLYDTLQELLRRRKLTVIELQQEARESWATKPDKAAELLELAAYKAWQQGNIDDAAGRSLAEIDSRSERLRLEALDHLVLGQYSMAADAFQRTISAARDHLATQVNAWRGWAVAETGRMLEPKFSTASPHPKQLKALADLVASATRSGPRFERLRASDALRVLNNELSRPDKELEQLPIRWLRADLQFCVFMTAAQEQLASMPGEAVSSYDKASTAVQDDSFPGGYREALLAKLGDPAAGRQVAEARFTRLELRMAAARAAEAALAADDTRLAEEKWNEAAELCEIGEPERASFRRDAFRARLRAGALSARAGHDPSTMSKEERSVALEALSVLQRDFPTDPWAQDRSKQWREHLLKLLASDFDCSAAALLHAHWPKDLAVAKGLHQIVRMFLKRWRSEAEACEKRLDSVTPAASRELIARAKKACAEMESAEGWVPLRDQQILSELEGRFAAIVKSVEDRKVKADKLRSEFETALKCGQPCQGILNSAIDAHLELYDDPERSVKELHLLFGTPPFRPLTLVWYRWMLSAERAWQSKDYQQARELLQQVTERQNRDTPNEVKTLAKEMLARLDQNLPADQRLTAAGKSAWEAWKRELLASLAPKSAAVAPLHTPPTSVVLSPESPKPGGMLSPGEPFKSSEIEDQVFASEDCRAARAEVEKKVQPLQTPGGKESSFVKSVLNCVRQCETERFDDAYGTITIMKQLVVTASEDICREACRDLLAKVVESRSLIHRMILDVALAKDPTELTDAERKRGGASLERLCEAGKVSGKMDPSSNLEDQSRKYKARWKAHIRS